MELKNKIAYKGFDIDNNNKLFCKPGQYKEYFSVGEIKEIQGELKLCHNGIHFCWDIKNVHTYYNLKEKVICEIEILGDVINESNAQKSCTNKIKVLRILTKEEVFELSNLGLKCTGVCNSGNRNSGDWNKTDYSNGFFNTTESKISLFNSPSNFTTEQFRKTKYYEALTNQYLILTEWVNYTDKEKESDKAKELIGGYLKRYDYTDACHIWWNKLSENNKQTIQQIPNFNKDTFLKITGIRL